MTILLIDGDVVCYGACKPRWLDRISIDDTVYFDIDGDGQKVIPSYSEEEDKLYLEEAWETFKKSLSNLLDKFYTTDYLMAVSGSWNYRDYIYSDYKANRRKNVNPQKLFVGELRRRAVENNLAIPADGCEADDFLRMWSEECRFNNLEYITCTIDKDLKCIPGKYYDLKKDTMEVVSEESALRYFYEQLLKGDSVDNIPGLWRVGDVKAKKWLEPFKTEAEFQEVIVTKYLEAYGDDWYDQLLSNGKLLYLQKHEYDYFNLRSWPLVQELKALD